MKTTLRKRVISIFYHESTIGQNNLNKIVFADGYVAHEKIPGERRTNFTNDKDAIFRITHPAKGEGKTDWIMFVANVEDVRENEAMVKEKAPVVNSYNEFQAMREYTFISQHSLAQAVAAAPFVFAGTDENESPRTDAILQLSEIFSEHIINNSKRLYEQSMQLPKGNEGENAETRDKKDEG